MANSSALQQAWKGLQDAIKWMSPGPVSPMASDYKHTLAEPGGFKQAVNNVVAGSTLRPQLIKPFPQEGLGASAVHTAKDLVNRIIPGQPFGNTPVASVPQPPRPPVPISLQDLFANAQKIVGGQVAPTVTPTTTPTPIPAGPTREQYIQVMQAMIPEIFKGGTPSRLPVADYAAFIYDETQKYPIFQKYPFLPIAQAILESSGFQNYSEPKRALGWGANIPGYNPADLKQVIADYASALGGRNQQEEQAKYPTGWQNRMSTSANYQPFRETGDLLTLANTYAPKSDNPEHGGDVYAGKLKWLMDLYQNQLTNVANNKEIVQNK